MFNEIYQLEQLKRSYEAVESAPLTYEEITERLEEGYKLASWLRAEALYNSQVATWLQYENRWHLTQHLVANNPAYRAAERGWLKMKELSPALDGVSNFGDLAPVLQARYAVFAEAAVNAVEKFEITSYVDQTADDDGQVCEDCPGGETCCFNSEDDYSCDTCHDYH